MLNKIRAIFGRNFMVILKFTGKDRILYRLTDEIDRKLLSLRYSGFLFDEGWIDSLINGKPVNKKGEPIPWISYSMKDFLEPRLNRNMEIFEFGSGASTLYFSKKVKQVYSVEHDLKWHDNLSKQLPENVKLIFQRPELLDDYSKVALNTGKKFDLVLIDGIERSNCAIQSFGAIKSNGIVLIDDSEREEYANAIQFYMERGYKKLEFWGHQPITMYKKCTLLLYKNENCVGI